MEQFLNYLDSTRITVSAFEIGFFLLLTTLSLLLKTKRFSLAISFIFAYRLGWLVISAAPHMKNFLTVFKIFGVGGIILLLAMFARDEK